ncbi:hypothetical protein [Lutibacter maritimus]|uniref:AP2 domain-containing protein n=1 Tax=Lutibacter maritimus TaxID=593133 RepID=A0A1I6NQU8_9FLAO|nr:hypothetical protein [Lutibacter maritimus]SFS30382.1 hypothetical protein SAMN04488006_0429 [Lutibacter maritimus]
MASILIKLRTEYFTEYSMKKYSKVKIYHGGLKKRWYVYFSFQNPKTGRLKRVTPFYGEAHKYKTKSNRMFVLAVYKYKITELL